MKWINYQYVCNKLNEETGGEVILLEKRIGYNQENLAVARKEAYNGNYVIEEDEESYEKEPLPIEFGGTGAKTPEEARAKLGILLSIEIEKIFEQYNRSSQSCKRDEAGNVIYKAAENYIFCESLKLTELPRNDDRTVTDTFETNYVLTLDGVQPVLNISLYCSSKNDYANPDYTVKRSCIGYLYDAESDTLLSQASFEISTGNWSSRNRLCTFTLAEEAQLYICENSPTLKFVLESTKFRQGDTLSFIQFYGLEFEVKKAEHFAFDFQEVLNA